MKYIFRSVKIFWEKTQQNRPECPFKHNYFSHEASRTKVVMLRIKKETRFSLLYWVACKQCVLMCVMMNAKWVFCCWSLAAARNKTAICLTLFDTGIRPTHFTRGGWDKNAPYLAFKPKVMETPNLECVLVLAKMFWND